MSETNNKPTHKAVFPETYKDRGGNEKTKFTEICPIWKNDKGTLAIRIPKGMFLTGTLLIVENKPKDENWSSSNSSQDDDLPF